MSAGALLPHWAQDPTLVAPGITFLLLSAYSNFTAEPKPRNEDFTHCIFHVVLLCSMLALTISALIRISSNFSRTKSADLADRPARCKDCFN